MATIVKCPACGKPVPWIDASRWRPFCSERCKINDLGDWAANRHVIAGSPPASADDVPPADDQGAGRH
ncbi:MAG: DNA gyrase inhibitor YacG [Burkholderiaceae bacterium]|nr:DNA gyrase inhibitor YacG [Burkholderiaceae bacterium]